MTRAAQPPMIDRARPDDVEAVLALLTENGLPVDGLRDHLATTLVARHDSQIVGSAALELYPDGALLRSVAIHSDRRNQRLGCALTEAVIRLAREQRMQALYLLTTTATGYFSRWGFSPIERGALPTGVRQSREFTSGCCSAATVMRKVLDEPTATTA
jgi:amino-acid N-acetyltransferase